MNYLCYIAKHFYPAIRINTGFRKIQYLEYFYICHKIKTMKKILCVSSILISSIAISQDLKFEGVVKLDTDIPQSELYNRARTWAKENYSSKNNYILTEDSTNGEISGVGQFDYRTRNKYKGFSCVEGPIKYNFSIFVKNERYKYLINSFDHKGSSGNLCRAGNFGRIMEGNNAPAIGKGIAFVEAWDDVKEKIQDQVKTVVQSIESGLKKKYEGNNDW